MKSGNLQKYNEQSIGKACKCFPRNPAQVNDRNGVAWLTSVRHKSSIP